MWHLCVSAFSMDCTILGNVDNAISGTADFSAFEGHPPLCIVGWELQAMVHAKSGLKQI